MTHILFFLQAKNARTVSSEATMEKHIMAELWLLERDILTSHHHGRHNILFLNSLVSTNITLIPGYYNKCILS